MKPTTQKITVGRVLHVYSEKWSGPRAGMVVNTVGEYPEASVELHLDGVAQADLIADLERTPCRNTLAGLGIYDIEPGEDAMLVDAPEGCSDYPVVGKCWAVWPPRNEAAVNKTPVEESATAG